jgi:hypothetical protein
VLQVLQVHKGSLGSKVLRELLVQLDHKELLVPKVLLVLKEVPELLVPQVLLVLRALPELQESLAPKAHLEPKGAPESLGLQVHRARQEQRVLRVLLVLRDQLVPQVLLVLRDHLELQVLLVLRVVLDHKGVPELLVPQDPRDLLE